MRVLILALAAQAAAAQTAGKPHAIEVRLKACSSANPSTHGEGQCQRTAEDEWDAELNRVYRKLQAKLSPERKANLTKAQLAWIAYRDAEFQLAAAVYDPRYGTMYGPIQAGRRMEVVRRRARELQGYLDELPLE